MQTSEEFQAVGYFRKKGKRGQLKIQQMAFVLVALMIFFAMASIFYISIRFSNLQEDVEDVREQSVIESVRKISGTAEFLWSVSGDCASCVDFDKVFVLKNRTSYKGFWKGVSFLSVERIYPVYNSEECTFENYPKCNKITLVDEDKSIRGHSAFVAICMYDSEGYNKCELGKAVMAFETVN